MRAVVLGVDEALTNIIRHAYAGHPDRPIEVLFRRILASSCGKSGEALEIVLVDSGKNVDRAKTVRTRARGREPGGLGLHFIRESMDALEFRRRGAGISCGS